MSRFALLLAGLFAGAMLAEGTVRGATLLSPGLRRLFREADPYAILVEPVGEFGYRQRPGRTFRYGNGTVATSNSLGFRGPDVSPRKPEGTLRIVLLGGSSTHGFGVNDPYTIDAYMRELLGQRYAGERFEVVNLAFDGYDSYQDFERLRAEGLRLDPDLVIVNSGINDVRNARFPNLADVDPRTLIWEADLRRLRREQREGPTWRTRLKHYSYLARLVPIIRENRRRRSDGRRGGVRTPPNPQAAERYEQNMLRIDSLVASRGVPVLYSTPPSSLREKYRPTDTSDISYWLSDAETTQRYRDELDRRLRDVVSRLRARGRPVAYVAHEMTADMFIDDCHLTARGNRQLAINFIAALEPFLRRKSATADRATRQRS